MTPDQFREMCARLDAIEAGIRFLNRQREAVERDAMIKGHGWDYNPVALHPGLLTTEERQMKQLTQPSTK